VILADSSKSPFDEAGRESSAERVLIWTPASIGRSVRAGNDHEIAVGVSHPALPVIRPAVTLGRISMPRYYDLDTHLGGTLHDRIKIVNLEPQ
jgi:hypothetical protein